MLFYLLFIFVFLLWPAESSEDTLTAKVGQTILLPCTYVVKSEPVHMCWGRQCNLLSCGQVVLRTDGQKVTYKKEKRYQLEGDQRRGNVSLTIENVAEADSGEYCCRIEFPGPLNDQKTSMNLVVKSVETTTFRLQTQQTSRTAQSNTPMEITRPVTKLPKTEDIRRIGIYSGVSIILLLVLFLAIVVLILKRNSYKKKKLQKPSEISKSNPLPKNLREIAEERFRVEENVYGMEEHIYESQDM